jgi:hypothetical protein
LFAFQRSTGSGAQDPVRREIRSRLAAEIFCG